MQPTTYQSERDLWFAAHKDHDPERRPAPLCRGSDNGEHAIRELCTTCLHLDDPVPRLVFSFFCGACGAMCDVDVVEPPGMPFAWRDVSPLLEDIVLPRAKAALHLWYREPKLENFPP
jgi:hypothetical protein